MFSVAFFSTFEYAFHIHWSFISYFFPKLIHLITLNIYFSRSVPLAPNPEQQQRHLRFHCGYRCLLMHYVITLNNPSSSSYIQCHSFQHFSPFLEVVFPVTIFNIPVNMLLGYLLCLPTFHVSFPQWKGGGPAFETKEPLLCFLSLLGYFFPVYLLCFMWFQIHTFIRI